MPATSGPPALPPRLPPEPDFSGLCPPGLSGASCCPVATVALPEQRQPPPLSLRPPALPGPQPQHGALLEMPLYWLLLCLSRQPLIFFTPLLGSQVWWASVAPAPTRQALFSSPHPALFLGGAPRPHPRPHISLLHPAIWLSAARQRAQERVVVPCRTRRVTAFEGGSGRRNFCPGHAESPSGQPGAAPGQCGRGSRAPPLSHFTKVGEARAAH